MAATSAPAVAGDAPVAATGAAPSVRNKSGHVKKPKKVKKPAAQCVGYYLDALDRKMLWAEAKIIDCDLAKQKIRVHFIGWGKSHDIWTDTVSIAKHGRYAPSAKANTTPSWDGDMHLFEDMLGPIDASTPCHDSVHGGVAGIANVAPAPPSAKRSVDAPVDRKASRSHKRKIVAEQPTKPSASRKRAKPTPTPAPAPAKAAFRKKVRRSVSALPEVAKVEPLTVDADTEERKQLIIDEMAQAAAFLEQCAGAWKRQLAEMRLEGKL